MDKIIILDENTSNQIAAGEVIERPASVVKELVENSIDAGADTIKIEISKGGISLIKVTDNGRGIPADDVEMAFERHGTSKLRNAGDLLGIRTMGFRGEALPSIASISKVDLNTSTGDNGVRIIITGGNIDGKQKSSREQGTTITVRNLFFNTPARYKFLKNDSTEARYCTDIISRLALAHTKVSFRYFSNGVEILRTPGDGNLKNAVFCVYGREISSNLYEINYEDEIFMIWGFIGNRSATRGNRQNQTTFINGRYIKSARVSAAVEKAYETEIMKGKFPFFIINIALDPKLVDVNVHPAKSEVRFAKGNEVFSAVHSAVKAALNINRGIVAGAVKQAHIKREIDYGEVRPGTENATFFSDSNDNTSINPETSRILHESFMDVKDAFYGMKEETETTPVVKDEPFKTGFNIDVLDKGKFFGILFNTFIMLGIDEFEIILIDQHAAHERITYESLLRRFKNRELNSQMLLAPQVIGLEPSEAIIAEESGKLLNDLGFEFDFIGAKDIALRAVPAEIIEKDAEEVFRGAVLAIAENSNTEHMLMEKEAIYTMACKSSIKANTVLTELEANTLIERLKSLDNPYTCPHGRPVIIKLTRRELEKLFKRIV